MNNSNNSLNKLKMLSKKEYQEARRLKPNDLHSVKNNDQKGQNKSIITNALINEIDPLATEVEEKRTSTMDKQDESIPQVPSCEIISPSKVKDQLETPFNIFKDEYTLEELLDLNITEIPFLVEKLIPKDTLVVLGGQSEIGKSTFYTQLTLAIINDDDEFLGLKLNAFHKRVLIISTEDGPIPLSFRTNKQTIKSTLGIDKRRNLKVIFNYEKPEERIRQFLENNPADLVVLDAFGDVFGGDINSSNSVRQFLNSYNKIIRKYRCSILFVHHVCKGNKKNKSEKDQLLGSTGIEGKMRNVIMLSMVNDQHQLRIAKGNYVSREDKKIPLYLNFDSETLTFTKADGPAKPKESDKSTIASSGGSRSVSKPGRKRDQKLYDQAIQLYKEGKSQVEIAKIIGVHKSTICKWIQEYEAKSRYDTSLVGDVD